LFDMKMETENWVSMVKKKKKKKKKRLDAKE
jgi:hypothetical protein